MRIKLLPLIIPLLGVLIYLPSMRYGFSQDDFIHIAASKVDSFGQVANFFNPLATFPDIFFFRPLSTQLYFFIFDKLFYLSPFALHAFGLLVHALNVWLFYLIVKKLWDRKIALLASFFYSISAVHFLSLYFISSFQELARTFYLFSAILFFIVFQETKSRKYLCGSIGAFCLALLAKENSIILPLILPVIEIIRRRGESWVVAINQAVKSIVPFVVVALLYLGLRLVGLQTLFQTGGYSYSLSPQNVIQNIKWYALWVLGLPEILSNYALGLGSLEQFSKDFTFGPVILVVFLVLVAFSVILINRGRLAIKIWLTGTILFVAALLPMLPLVGHRYPQYLDLAFLGVLPILAKLLLDTRKKFLAIGFIGLFVSLQIVTLRLTEQTHWTTHRAQVASFYQATLEKDYPTLPKDTTIIFVGNNQTEINEVSVALANHYALNIWYPGVVKQVIYKITNDTSLPPAGSITIPITKY